MSNGTSRAGKIEGDEEKKGKKKEQQLPLCEQHAKGFSVGNRLLLVCCDDSLREKEANDFLNCIELDIGTQQMRSLGKVEVPKFSNQWSLTVYAREEEEEEESTEEEKEPKTTLTARAVLITTQFVVRHMSVTLFLIGGDTREEVNQVLLSLSVDDSLRVEISEKREEVEVPMGVDLSAPVLCLDDRFLAFFVCHKEDSLAAVFDVQLQTWRTIQLPILRPLDHLSFASLVGDKHNRVLAVQCFRQGDSLVKQVVVTFAAHHLALTRHTCALIVSHWFHAALPLASPMPRVLIAMIAYFT